MTIPSHVIVDLCKLGELGESESAHARTILGRLVPWDEVNRQGRQAWTRATDSLDTAAVANLVRGLVLTEEALRWSGGSVSGVIWTYRALLSRDPDAASLVADWGSERTTNSFVPFRRPSAGELAAMRRMAAAKEANKARNEEEHQRSESRRTQRSRVVHEHAVATTTNSRERASFLQTCADLPVAARLEAVLSNPDRALSWFPEAWATEALRGFATLDPQLRGRLIERLAGRNKGPWQKLREALVAASGR